MTELCTLGTKLNIEEKVIDLIGYNVSPVPMSEFIWLDKDVHLSFYLKVLDNPLDYSAIVDIEFFNSNKAEIVEKENSKSFVSIVIEDKDIVLYFKEFNINYPFFRNLFRYDKEWHKFEIKIFRDNLWCPNKRCKFEHCAHTEAKSLGDAYLKWNPKDIKRHRRVSLSIDGSEEIYFNYMSHATNAIISFSNNNVDQTQNNMLVDKIVESALINRPSISLKNINAVYDEDEIKFVFKNHINPPTGIDINW